jgi:hypothetical protein
VDRLFYWGGVVGGFCRVRQVCWPWIIDIGEGLLICGRVPDEGINIRERDPLLGEEAYVD